MIENSSLHRIGIIEEREKRTFIFSIFLLAKVLEIIFHIWLIPCNKRFPYRFREDSRKISINI